MHVQLQVDPFQFITGSFILWDFKWILHGSPSHQAAVRSMPQHHFAVESPSCQPNHVEAWLHWIGSHNVYM
jgi:hypothetical protein